MSFKLKVEKILSKSIKECNKERIDMYYDFKKEIEDYENEILEERKQTIKETWLSWKFLEGLDELVEHLQDNEKWGFHLKINSKNWTFEILNNQ